MIFSLSLIYESKLFGMGAKTEVAFRGMYTSLSYHCQVGCFVLQSLFYTSRTFFCMNLHIHKLVKSVCRSVIYIYVGCIVFDALSTFV